MSVKDVTASILFSPQWQRVEYLVLDCVQGFVPGSVFQTLSNPAVDGPVSQVPAVWTVTKPGG